MQQKRWTGRYQQVDNLRVAGGYTQFMDTLATTYTADSYKKRAQPLYAFINQQLRTYKDDAAILYPMLFLYHNGLFIGSMQELQARGLLDQNFNETQLISVCQESWVDLKQGESMNVIIKNVQLVQENPRTTLFELEYRALQKPSKVFVTQLELVGTPTREQLTNYLPVLLYQIASSTEYFHQDLEFVKPRSPEYQKIVKTVFGTLSITTKTNLKAHLLKLQDDLGFYRLNKPNRVDYFRHLTDKTTVLVFATDLKTPLIQLSDVETWMTGYVINNTASLHYNIVKQGADEELYPWIYTTRSPTMFPNQNHLKLELVCRQKLYPELQGIGFTLMTYFLTLYSTNYANLNFVLMDVSRTHADRGLPDPMFCQLLHERFKFQRTFDLNAVAQSMPVRGLPEPEVNAIQQTLSTMFDVQKPAPYTKVYLNGVDNNTLQNEFIDLPQDVNVANIDPATQVLLQTHSKSFTFVRPMPTLDNLNSIYQRFIQSYQEKANNLELGGLQAF